MSRHRPDPNQDADWGDRLPTVDTVELASNYYGTRAHYSIDLAGLPYQRGRRGTSLCHNENMTVDVYGQDAVDHQIEFAWRNRKIIADMPLCKKCVAIAKKRGLVTP